MGSEANPTFVAELAAMIAARRSFGGHPLWHAIAAGRVSRPGLQLFAQQFFLQVREFPRAVSALHSNCPFPDVRRQLAESVYEEETGRISGCNLPHPELFLVFGRALGLARESLTQARPLPGTAALIDWFELSSKQRSFIEGAAAINLAAEGQVPGAFGPFARALEKHYGLAREAVAFWDVHEIADRDHSEIGDHIVVRFADTNEIREQARSAVAHSLDMWWQFFDGMERAIAHGASPQPG
jgi:pyrroloquinoline-quinone synthase